MASKRKSTLDQIAELLKPAPEIGSDDDLDFDTKAKVIEEFEDEFNEEYNLRRPTIKQSAALDDDPRYIGKRVSRKAARIAEDSGNESSEGSDTVLHERGESCDSEESFKSPHVEIESAKEDCSENEQGSESDEEYGEFEEHESEDNDEYSIMESNNSKVIDDEDDEGQTNEAFQHVSSEKSVESEIEKGKAVKNQLNIWDNLLESRIHLQKCLIPVNRFPKHHKIDLFKEEGGEEFALEMKKTTHSVRKLLDKLMDLQDTLIKNYSETKNLGQKFQKEKKNSDEQIPSDSDVDGEGDADDDDLEPLKAKPPKKKRRHCEDYEAVLNTNHKQYLEFRDATIQKWNDRTRLITGKASSRDFSAFEQSTLQQIRHVLSNRSRLLQRTRIPRSFGPILGDPEPAENSQPDHDPEIFDDSDFYHQLLRELIERRTDDSHDATALGRRWAALQKLRTKMKRRVDTRATKGRRLRYDPHQKLVGFMAPVVPSSEWNDKAITELFNSLFGKKL